MSEPALKRGRYAAFSLAEKIWLLDYQKDNPSLKAEALGQALGEKVNEGVADGEKRKPPGKNTVNGWVRGEEKLREQYRSEMSKGGREGKQIRVRTARHPQLEEALFDWFKQQKSQDLGVNLDTMRMKAKTLGDQLGVGDFQYSYGWLSGFKQRFGIKSLTSKRQAGSADNKGVQISSETDKTDTVDPGEDKRDISVEFSPALHHTTKLLEFCKAKPDICSSEHLAVLKKLKSTLIQHISAHQDPSTGGGAVDNA